MGNARSFKRRAGVPAAGDSGAAGASGLASRDPGRCFLWFSNAPWAGTGYGTQGKQVVERIVRDGHDIAYHVNYGFESGNTAYRFAGKDITVYGSGFGQWRNDSIKANALHFSQVTGKQPVVITLCDVWTMKPDLIDEIPVLSWTPVDHAPMPPMVGKWFENKNVRAVAMSKFGQKMFEGADIDALYAPHAFEPVFQPTPVVNVGEEKSPRELLQIPNDRFVVMMNAANKGVSPNRKAFAENLLAFSMFAEKHDDVMLYMHTERHGAMGGIDLDKLMKAVGIKDEQVRFVDQYAYRSGITNHILASFYTMADVLLTPSRGEGFGICAIESQACGTPIITSDWTAQPELCGDGWIVKSQPEWDPMQDSWFSVPLVSEIVDALEQAYQRGGGHSQKAVDWAQQYAADTVFDTYWRPILGEVVA